VLSKLTVKDLKEEVSDYEGVVKGKLAILFKLLSLTFGVRHAKANMTASQ